MDEPHSKLIAKLTEGEFLTFEGSLGMSLEGDCYEVDVTPNLKLLVTFDKSFDGVCHDLYI
jgi:hypothetical protein